MKTFSYTRVSTTEQAQTGHSLATQEDRINAYCTSKGLPQPELFKDAGISGKKKSNRPALNEMLSKAQKGDTIITFSLSRLARNTIETLQIISDLKKRGINFVSITEDINTSTASGKFFLTVLSALAEMESAQLGERIKAVAANRKSQNLTYCNKITGFDKVFDTLPDGRRTNGRLVPNESLKIVQLIKFLKAQKKSAFTIAEELNMDEFKTITGKAFHQNSITAILNNPIYNNVEPSNELLLPKEEPQEAVSCD